MHSPSRVFLLTKGWVGLGGCLPVCCLAGAGAVSRAGPQGGGKAVSLGSSSWAHQLGLALRSRWDMEIPVCP